MSVMNFQSHNWKWWKKKKTFWWKVKTQWPTTHKFIQNIYEIQFSIILVWWMKHMLQWNGIGYGVNFLCRWSINVLIERKENENDSNLCETKTLIARKCSVRIQQYYNKISLHCRWSYILMKLWKENRQHRRM